MAVSVVDTGSPFVVRRGPGWCPLCIVGRISGEETFNPWRAREIPQSEVQEFLPWAALAAAPAAASAAAPAAAFSAVTTPSKRPADPEASAVSAAADGEVSGSDARPASGSIGADIFLFSQACGNNLA